MKRHSMLAAAIMAVIILSGGNAKAEFDIKSNETYAGILRAETSEALGTALGRCFGACNTSVIQKTSEAGMASLKACKDICKGAASERKQALAAGPAAPAATEKVAKKGGSWSNPCKPSPCGEGNQCKPTKNAEKKWVADCYCEGRSMKYGETCENTFAPPPPAPIICMNKDRVVGPVQSEADCVDSTLACVAAGTCLPIPESIHCHLTFWMITFLIVLAIIGGLIYTTIRFRKKWRQAELAVDRTKTMWREALGMANTRLAERNGEQVPEPVLQSPQSAKKK